MAHFSRARRGVSRAYRRGGAVRRHGPLRRDADTARMVRAGVSFTDDQLLRPGGARAARSGGDEKPVLSARAGGTADAAGAPCHDSNRDRIAGDDFRGVLGYAAGHAPRLSAARAYPAHLRNRARPDLHPAGELDHAGAGHPARAGFQKFERNRIGLWHCGIGDHGADDGAHLGGCRIPAETAEPAVPCRARADRHGGTRVLRREHHQDCRRRLVPARVRPGAVCNADDLETSGDHPRFAREQQARAAGCLPDPVQRRYSACAGHRRVPVAGPWLGTDSADAQPQTQQGSAPAHRVPDHRQ